MRKQRGSENKLERTQFQYTNLTEVEVQNLKKPSREATPPFPRRTKTDVKYFEINGFAKQKYCSRLAWEESTHVCGAVFGCSRLVHDVYGVYKFTLSKWQRAI